MLPTDAVPMDQDHEPNQLPQEYAWPSANQELASEARGQQLPTPSPQQGETTKSPKMLSIDMDMVHRVYGEPAPSSPQRTTCVPPSNLQLRRRQKPKVREHKRGDLQTYLEGIKDPAEWAAAAKAFMHSSKYSMPSI